MRMRLWRSSLLDFYPDETSRTFIDAESASPAVARNELLPVEGLLVSPKQIERRAGRLFPAQLIKHMPFPRWRMTSHVIELKRRRPTKSAPTRHKKCFITRLRHNGKMLAAIFSCG